MYLSVNVFVCKWICQAPERICLAPQPQGGNHWFVFLCLGSIYKQNNNIAEVEKYDCKKITNCFVMLFSILMAAVNKQEKVGICPNFSEPPLRGPENMICPILEFCASKIVRWSVYVVILHKIR